MDAKCFTPRELALLREKLTRLARQGAESTEAVKLVYTPDTPAGKQIYESLSDADLLNVLQEAAQSLGHPPAQSEIYWVYRSYLRLRFGNWPNALRRAGLPRAAGVGGKSPARLAEEETRIQSLLVQVREKAAALGRTPHPSDLPQVRDTLKKRYGNWGEVLAAAGVEAGRTAPVFLLADLEDPYRSALEEIRIQAMSLGRAPLRKEAIASLEAASSQKKGTALYQDLVARCGSWRNTLYQLGLEPVMRIAPFSTAYLSAPTEHHTHRGTLHDCYYRVLHLDAATLARLAEVETLARELDRAPEKGEVAPQMRQALIAVCGSWPNVLFQLNLHHDRKDEKNDKKAT